MQLTPGTRLDQYEIVELLGKGGMGEVYRGKDTRLPREVAIKVSAEKFTERFAREAKIIASLNHPNICTLFDVGTNYLVMELVEGPTLAERISPGGLPQDEALGIARQIAAALDYAHEKKVAHRDLKPANIKIRPDGAVKVLDFGLAKALVDEPSSGDETRTFGRTEAGAISASGFLPSLRFGEVSLDEAERFLHNRSASIAPSTRKRRSGNGSRRRSGTKHQRRRESYADHL